MCDMQTTPKQSEAPQIPGNEWTVKQWPDVGGSPTSSWDIFQGETIICADLTCHDATMIVKAHNATDLLEADRDQWKERALKAEPIAEVARANYEWARNFRPPVPAEPVQDRDGL